MFVRQDAVICRNGMREGDILPDQFTDQQVCFSG